MMYMHVCVRCVSGTLPLFFYKKDTKDGPKMRYRRERGRKVGGWEGVGNRDREERKEGRWEGGSRSYR